MIHFIKTTFILSLFIGITVLSVDSLHSQTKSIPITVTCRESFLKGSYVLQIQSLSNDKLNLWLQAKGKTFQFLLPAGKMIEFGWAQGYKFDANNLFLIGGSGFDTIKQEMPNTELSPWRIGFADGGLALSLSQSFLQTRLPKYLELPVKENISHNFYVAINQVPQIILKEGSDRVYSNAILEVSITSLNLHVPVVASVSFVPFYVASTGQIIASQIKVENIDMNVLPKEWLDETTKIANNVLPVLFAKYIFYQLEQKWLLKVAKAVHLRTKVIDGRLEIIIL
jgi:hypothetical protein